MTKQNRMLLDKEIDARPRQYTVSSRRTLLTVTGAGTAAAMAGFPFIAPARAATKTLSFWQFYAPGGPVPAQAKWFEHTVKSWNAAHDIKIQLQYVPTGEYMNGTKLPTAFASGQGPDIFLISAGDFLRYYNGKALADISPHMDAQARADFTESIIATRMVDGKIYALPMEVEPMAFYYSVEAFEKAALNEHDVPKTWDELLDLAKKLTTGKRFGVLFDTNPGYYQNFTWYPFMWQGGGDIVGKNGKSTFNSPATVAALKFWQDAVKSGAAPRTLLGGGGFDIVPNLGSGYCAIQNCGSWGIKALKSGAPNFKYGVFRLPLPPGGKYITIGGGWAFVANARGRDPETAAKFCAWAIGSSSKASVQRVVDWCTVAKSDMPPRESAFKIGAAAYDAGMLKIFRDSIFPGTRAEPRVPPQVYKAISDAIQACQLNGQDPARQAALASQQIDGYLAGYHGARIL